MSTKTAIRRSSVIRLSAARGRGGRKHCRGDAAASRRRPSIAGLAYPRPASQPDANASETNIVGGVSGSTEVLKGAAEAVAASLIDGSPLEVMRLRQLRDALLAETADAGNDAARRCAYLRRGLAKALRLAISSRPGTTHLIKGGVVPPTRVEVRNSAGRAIVAEAFTVGRGPECDVQTSGDCTVSRLQFVAVSLPGGLVIADAWSSGGTRVVRRFGEPNSLPASVPGKRAAFLVPHGERIVFMIGARTTVTLGPKPSGLIEMLVPAPVTNPAPLPPVGSNGEVVRSSGKDMGHTEIAKPSDKVPAVSEAHNVQSEALMRMDDCQGCPSGNVSDVDMCSPDLAAHEAPDPQRVPGEADNFQVCERSKINAVLAAGCTEDPQAFASRAEDGSTFPVPKLGSNSAAAAPGGAEHHTHDAKPILERTTSLPRKDQAAPENRRAHGAASLSRCLLAVKAGVRMQQAVAARERLRWRCRVAKRSGLVTTEQCDELQEMLKPPANNSDEVADILDGLGVPLAPDDLAPPGTPSWECPVCRNLQRSRGWRCPFQHRSCRDCMAKWCETTTSPSCPHEGCGYRLGEQDLEDLRVSAAHMDAFRAGLLERGLDALQDSQQLGSQVRLFRCAGAGCSAAIVVGADDDRRRYACTCGAPPVCTGCGTSPYHYHGHCGDTQSLRARWLAWLQGGREAYQGLQKRAKREATAQQSALREAMARHVELEQDEEWKAQVCRLCPKCKLPIDKVDGCNTIVCGQNTHGGNRQPGCGHRFKWSDAPPYRPQAEKCHIRSAPALSRVGAISGRGVRHLFAQCAFCNSGKCIVGPRFRCIHCPNFNCCLKCEPRLAAEHEEGHVFEILFEDDVDWGETDVVLPKGTSARIRRTRGVAAAVDAEGDGQDAGRTSDGRKRRRQNSGLEGVVKGQKRGKYILELAGGMGVRHVLGENLQPLLTQKQAERLLVAASEGDGGTALKLRAEGHA